VREKKNKKGELTYWNFVATDGVIGNQVNYYYYYYYYYYSIPEEVSGFFN
jgi:hypothetical protein